MNINKQVIIGVKWTTLGTLSVTLSNVLKVSILARFLSKDDFGVFAIVVFFLGFFKMLSEMGLTTAILHKQDIKKNEYASLYWFNIILCICLYLLLFLITPIISGFYNEPELDFLIKVLGLSIIINSIGLQFRTIETKNLSFKYINIFDIIASVISLSFAIWLAVNGYGILALVYSVVLEYAISNFLLFFLGLRNHGVRVYFRFKDLKPFLRIGLFQVGGQSANFFNRNLDILIIGKFFSQEVLGGYSLAKQLVFRPTQVINPILAKVAAPTLAKFQNNLELLKENYLKLVNVVSSVNFVSYFILIVFAPIIVEIFYGGGYSSIVLLVRILCVYMVFRAILNPIGSLVVATGRTDIQFIWNIVLLILMPIVVYAGSMFGIVEVTIALTVTMILLFLPSWYFLVRKMSGATLKEYVISIIRLYN
ncbi:MAG: MOP flippase family protein [Flavobacteriales bacterium]|jgi:O-antigen/teichoic acid export membrane protein|nr:MOP flippase family protein [Flavobacteriales bacterium]